MAKDSRLKKQENGYYYFDKVVNGKRIRKSLKTKTYKEAIKLADKLEAEKKYGKGTDLNGNIKIKDFTEIYLEEKKKQGLAPNSQKAYVRVLKNFNLFFGNTNITDMKPKQLQIYMNELVEKNNYSKKTITQVKSVLSNFFKTAMYVEFGYIDNNPMIPVRIPTVATTKKANMYIPIEHINAMLELASTRNTGLYTALNIQWLTGMRISEVLGLTWDCIDLKNKVITLKKQLYAPSKKQYELRSLKAEKNGEKQRNILINDYLVRVLKAQKKKQKENKLKYGEKYLNNKYNFVCTKDNGTYVHYLDIKNFFIFLQKKLNVKYSSHWLRHTHVTDLMHNSSLSKEAIKQRVGHNSLDMTQYYTEEKIEANKKIADYTEEIAKNIDVKIMSK